MADSPLYEIKSTSTGTGIENDEEDVDEGRSGENDTITIYVKSPDHEVEEYTDDDEEDTQSQLSDVDRLTTSHAKDAVRMEDLFSLADSDSDRDYESSHSDVDSDLEAKMNGVKNDPLRGEEEDDEDKDYPDTEKDDDDDNPMDKKEGKSEQEDDREKSVTKDKVSRRKKVARKKSPKKKADDAQEKHDSNKINKDDEQDKPVTKTKPKRKPSVKKKTQNTDQDQEKFGRCPVCHEVLDRRIRRVYTKHISTEVFFPCLETTVMAVPKHGHVPKVKICYACYEHLIRQWKEYSHAGIPHRKRRYRDRNGHRIVNEKEIKKRSAKKHRVPTVPPPDTATAETSSGDDVQAEKEVAQAEKEAIEASVAQDDYDDQVKRLQREMDTRDHRLADEMDSLRLGIERAVKKQGNRLKDEIQCVKVENQLVRKNLVRMRREVREMRTEFAQEIKAVKKKSKKMKRPERVLDE